MRHLKGLCLVLAVFSTAGMATAADTYVNDGSSTAEFVTASGYGPLGPAYVGSDGSSVRADLPTGPPGYLQFWLGGPAIIGTTGPDNGNGSLAGAPIDVTGDTMTLRLRFDYTGTGAVPSDTVGCWVRVYSGQYNAQTGKWTWDGSTHARAGYFVTVKPNAGWQTFTKRIADTQDLRSGIPLDTHNVFKIRFDFVFWEDKFIPCTFGIDHVEIGPPQTPTIRTYSPNPDEAYPGIEYTPEVPLLNGDHTVAVTKLQGPASLVAKLANPYTDPFKLDDTNGWQAIKLNGWTPTDAEVGQTYTIEVKAENSIGSDTESWTVKVVWLPPIIATIPPGFAYAGSAYLQQPSLIQGTPPVTWSKTQGPATLTVDPVTGAVSGWTPTTADIGSTVTLGIQAANGGGTDTETWQVQVIAAPADGDDVAPPWGTVAGNISGTQSTTDAGMVFHNDWNNGVLVDWTLDVKAAGLAPATHYGRISFDEAGNLYWKTIDGFLVSAAPTGTIRWTGNDAGTAVDLGVGDMSTPVVGQGDGGNVYVTADSGVAAYAKTDGHRVWDTALPDALFGGTGRLTPVLYQGHLYVVGAQPNVKSVYVINAATGAIVVSQMVPGFDASTGGEMTLVPNALGTGVHGLYFNCDGGGAAGMYAVAVNPSGAYLAWKDSGGKVARSHVIYLSTAQRVATHTWNDYGAAFYTWNLDGTLPASTGNVANNAAHGFEDLGAVDFNGVDVIAGAFDGRLVRYMGIAIPGSVTPPLPQVVYDAGGFESFALGSIVGQDGWAGDNAGTPQADPQIVADPTNSGHGKVLEFAPTGTSPDDYTTYMGAVRAAVASTGAGVTIEWDQYFTDTTPFMWLADNAAYNGWYTLLHNGSGLLGTSGDSGKIAITPGVWQHVMYTFNPAAGTVTLTLGGKTATAGTTDKSIAGIDFEVGPGVAGSGPLYVDGVVIKQGPAPTPNAFAGNGYYQMDELYRENRGYGGLFKSQSGHSIVLTGTSTESGSSHIVAMDVTATPLLTEAPPQDPQARWFDFDTTATAPPTGGPILGPTPVGGKQHVYYFDGTTGELVALTYKARFLPDCNQDGKVNLDDFDQYWLPCYTGPMMGPPVPPAGKDCACTDLNKDGNVDQVDFGLFQRCFSGSVASDLDPSCFQ